MRPMEEESAPSDSLQGFLGLLSLMLVSRSPPTPVSAVTGVEISVVLAKLVLFSIYSQRFSLGFYFDAK